MHVNEEEARRALEGISSAYSTPYIDDVEDYVWESIWTYAKGLPSSDRLHRSKRLFDVVDPATGRGWSAKTLVVADLTPGREFEFVIQRADIIKKQLELGFSGLSISVSSAQDLGDAVLAHWRRKVIEDSAFQGVSDPMVAILLKNRSRTRFAVIEEPLPVPRDDEITWQFTRDDRTGLQGRSVQSGSVLFRWYPNQTQLFERRTVPESRVEVTPTVQMLSPEEFHAAILRPEAPLG